MIIEMSSFNCIIGENNSGKSSLLHAVQSFLDGKKLKESDYYNPSEPVIITVKFEIDESDLSLIVNEEHRQRIADLIINNQFILTQSFPFNDKAKMTCTKLVPKDAKWSDAEITNTISGKRGAELKQAVIKKYPEIEHKINSINGQISQIKVKDIIYQYISDLPIKELENNNYCDLPTGIPASVESMLPDPIFIPAVKDITEDLKTTDKAVFGKLIGLVLTGIENEKEMESFKEALVELDKKLNIIEGVDNRFSQIITVEDTIEKNIKENFKNIKIELEIPPPDLKKVLQSAEIKITEGGVKGGVETKGDGLKRAVLFSLFKSLAQLTKPKTITENKTNNYIILFEEPELYLHPTAQQIIFDSLYEISKSYQVVVTTHSPLFFSARKTKGFAKLIKYDDQNETPYSKLISVDVEKDLRIKDEFQILCFENNNVAFFAEKVVLVEGDSDILVMKHIAHTLNSDWDFEKGKIRMVKVCGKGSFFRFREFFVKFDIKPFIIADLDVILSNFDKLGIQPDSQLMAVRSALIQAVDKYRSEPNYNGKDIKNTWKENGKRILKIVSKINSGEIPTEEDIDYLNYIEEKLGSNKARLDVLMYCEEIESQKQTFLKNLRKEGIMILDRGCLEDYYPENVTGKDKPLKAESFRKTITTREQILSLASNIPCDNGENKNEFEVIFSCVFEN